MNILDLVSTTLEPLEIITVYGWYDESINNTHITFLEFDNLEDEFGDDSATTEEHYITVDLWTKDVIESQSLKTQIKQLLKQKGLLYQDGADQTEPQVDGSVLYHITTRWLIIENLE